MRHILLALFLAITVQAGPPQLGRATVEVAFDDDGLGLILKTIRDARKEIVAAIYNLSEPEVVDALLKAKRQRQVAIQIKYDKAQATQEKMGIAIKLLSDAGIEAIQCRGKKGGMFSAMHNKFMVVDGARVLTGSQNWSRNGFTDNWENVILVEDADVAEKCLQQWRRVE